MCQAYYIHDNMPNYFSTKDVDCNSGEWACEHRWPVIAGMAGFAKATNGESKFMFACIDVAVIVYQ